jgi:hypothetical protein
MNCPDCFSSEIHERHATGYEPHGEVHYEEWLHCSTCDLDFDEDDALIEIEEEDGPRFASEADEAYDQWADNYWGDRDEEVA